MPHLYIAFFIMLCSITLQLHPSGNLEASSSSGSMGSQQGKQHEFYPLLSLDPSTCVQPHKRIRESKPQEKQNVQKKLKREQSGGPVSASAASAPLTDTATKTITITNAPGQTLTVATLAPSIAQDVRAIPLNLKRLIIEDDTTAWPIVTLASPAQPESKETTETLYALFKQTTHLIEDRISKATAKINPSKFDFHEAAQLLCTAKIAFEKLSTCASIEGNIYATVVQHTLRANHTILLDLLVQKESIYVSTISYHLGKITTKNIVSQINTPNRRFHFHQNNWQELQILINKYKMLRTGFIYEQLVRDIENTIFYNPAKEKLNQSIYALFRRFDVFLQSIDDEFNSSNNKNLLAAFITTSQAYEDMNSFLHHHTGNYERLRAHCQELLALKADTAQSTIYDSNTLSGK